VPNDLVVAGFQDVMRSSGQGRWRVDGTTVIGDADARTDLFVDPGSGAETLNAPRLLTTAPDGDFQLSARVEVSFSDTFDAAVLLLWSDERTWAKLCFEYSPQGQPMVVSVVTRDVSDDANSFTADGSTAWLRVSRAGRAYAFHASIDGLTWDFVRNFSLGDARPDVGFEVQAPVGAGCSSTFSEISYATSTLSDLRDGS
jgi:regulation of enolase protein 1 (concanavalin A-like superfamily)